MNMSLTASDSTAPSPPLIFFNILERMCLNIISNESNPLLNAVQLMVSKVLIFNKNTELLPYGDSDDISPGNNYPTDFITVVLAGIPIINQIGWEEVSK